MRNRTSCRLAAWLSAGVLFWAGCADKPTERPARGKPTAEDVRLLRARSKKGEQARAGPDTVLLFGQPGVKETAADALARIGHAAVPALVEALGDPDPEVRAGAARALARMGPEAQEAVPALIAALRDEDKLARQSAARALGQMGPAAEAAIPALVEVLKQPDESRQSGAAAAGTPPGSRNP